MKMFTDTYVEVHTALPIKIVIRKTELSHTHTEQIIMKPKNPRAFLADILM